MQIITDITALREARSFLRGRVGLVPTMGALHAGHLALVRHARAISDHVIATIFVNPSQFNDPDDLDHYPRTLDSDLEQLEAENVDVVFIPPTESMYPAGHQTYIHVQELSDRLEGEYRPGHFQGVTTILAKLFHIITPSTMAFFGQKDAQQVVVVKRMVYDLNFPLEIIAIPTVRESDGLALSSRNVFLTSEERAVASIIYQSLKNAATQYDSGERDPSLLKQTLMNTMNTVSEFTIDYVSVAFGADAG